MKFQKCFFCNKLTPTPFHVTEIDGENVQSVDLCTRCAKEYMASLEPSQPTQSTETVDLSHITTPEQLLELLTGTEAQFEKQYPPKDPCVCGMTLQEFDECGRFGCPQCYSHFTELIEAVVLPYHSHAEEHVGKRPRYRLEQEKDPQEKLKVLKLRLAQAIELEAYEQAAVLNEEIKQLNQSIPAVSEDQ